MHNHLLQVNWFLYYKHWEKQWTQLSKCYRWTWNVYVTSPTVSALTQKVIWRLTSAWEAAKVSGKQSHTLRVFILLCREFRATFTWTSTILDVPIEEVPNVSTFANCDAHFSDKPVRVRRHSTSPPLSARVYCEISREKKKQRKRLAWWSFYHTRYSMQTSDVDLLPARWDAPRRDAAWWRGASSRTAGETNRLRDGPQSPTGGLEIRKHNECPS